MNNMIFSELFILDMANNHNGDIHHGINIINECKKVLDTSKNRIAIKFQYRDLETFIHPDHQQSSDIQMVNRFQITSLSEDDFLTLLGEVKKNGFLSICTPFDENSVAKVVEHGFDFLKIASCSFTDWPLITTAVKTRLPMILSTGGASSNEIDQVVDYLLRNNTNFALMHCTSTYPSIDDDLNLNKIVSLKARYDTIPIGWSTHEPPENLDAITLARGAGATLFERHVGLRNKKYSLNGYSSTPHQIASWISTSNTISKMYISKNPTELRAKENQSLRKLKRGVFAKKNINSEDAVPNNIYFAFPAHQDQLGCNGNLTGKFRRNIGPHEPILLTDVDTVNRISTLLPEFSIDLRKFAYELPKEIIIAHHYGEDLFLNHGALIADYSYNEIGRKILKLLPEQTFPSHRHNERGELFKVLQGDLTITFDNNDVTLSSGQEHYIPSGEWHELYSSNGTIIEEHFICTDSLASQYKSLDIAAIDRSKRTTIVKIDI